MTDNTIAFGTADDQTSYGFQLQPIIFYNTEIFGGSYIGYNNLITYDWSASGSDAWQVPVGLTAGKTFIL